MGTTGPASIDPATGKPYGLDFPIVTIADMVRAQALLIDQLGIETCSASPAAPWAACRCCNGRPTYPDRVFAALPIATSARHSSQNIAFHEVGRQAVMADPDWRGGRYLIEGARPRRASRSRAWPPTSPTSPDSALQRKFGRNLQDAPARDLFLRRRFPGGKLPASPGRDLRRAVRSPIPTSTSPARWTISTSPPTTAARWRRLQGLATCAFASSPSPRTGSFPTAEFARHRAGAQRRRRLRLLRRDRDRQGPRRLPARRAGADRHDARLHRRRRPRRRGIA